MPKANTRRLATVFTAALTIASLSGAAAAQSRWAVGADVGTPGLGAEISFMATPQWTIRLDGDSFDYNGTIRGTVLEYKGKLKLQTAGLFADFHPWTSPGAAPFLVSFGAYMGTRQAGAQPQLQSVNTIGGDTFTLGEVGVLQGKVKLDSFAPFLGVGWNNTFYNKHFGVKIMAGALWGDQPSVTLSRTGGVALPPDVAARLQAALAAESARLSDKLDILKVYPVLQVGLAYRF
jgi:hypothetical protein